MIYRPDIINPMFQYLEHGEGHKYIWITLIAVMLWLLHPGITKDFQSNNVKDILISLTKWYLTLIVFIASMYIVLFHAASFKILVIGILFSIITFYMYATRYGKKDA